MTGKFIVVEGLDGSGKSNAVAVISQVLQEKGIDFITTFEPGGTPLANGLRAMLKNGVEGDFAVDEATVLMMYAARVQVVETVIKPALEAGKWVISDRHNLSSFAYQGAGQGQMELVNTLSRLTLGNFKPDLTFLLDISPEIALQRAKNRGELDAIEQKGLDFFHRVRDCYLELAQHNDDVIIVDAEAELDEVSQTIRNMFLDFLTPFSLPTLSVIEDDNIPYYRRSYEDLTEAEKCFSDIWKALCEYATKKSSEYATEKDLPCRYDFTWGCDILPKDVATFDNVCKFLPVDEKTLNTLRSIMRPSSNGEGYLARLNSVPLRKCLDVLEKLHEARVLYSELLIS